MTKKLLWLVTSHKFILNVILISRTELKANHPTYDPIK